MIKLHGVETVDAAQRGGRGVVLLDRGGLVVDEDDDLLVGGRAGQVGDARTEADRLKKEIDKKKKELDEAKKG